MKINDAILDSWDRQSGIVNSVASLIDESNRKLLPSSDGWPLDKHLAHIHLVRKFWLKEINPSLSNGLAEAFVDGWDTPIDDLQLIKESLLKSAMAVREAMEKSLSLELDKAGAYDNPLLFLQHIIWHEGWHVGLIILGLRLGGLEPSEEWEELNVWGQWRTEDVS